MNIEIKQHTLITDWVDICLDGTTHYEVYRNDSGWCVNECGFSGRDTQKGIETKTTGISRALRSLADDIERHGWIDNELAYRAFCPECGETFETQGRPSSCSNCHSSQITVR